MAATTVSCESSKFQIAFFHKMDASKPISNLHIAPGALLKKWQTSLGAFIILSIELMESFGAGVKW